MKKKRCTKCRKEKPMNKDNFHRKRSTADGFQKWCIACVKDNREPGVLKRRTDPRHPWRRRYRQAA